MAGYTINDLKKAGSLSGQDAIPVQQNGITRQFEVGIMDNASLVKQSGSQSSGVIRKAQTFVLQSATKINFTLENAVGRIVTDNEYVDNAEAASGWKVYVVNISSIEHTVIHGANSWPVPAGEILCFYWTGSRFTLHNIVINNITVRGDTKLLNISAVQALAAANKIPVIGTDGKLASTTAQAIVDLANVDGKINNALTNYVPNGLQKMPYIANCNIDLSSYPLRTYITGYATSGTLNKPNENWGYVTTYVGDGTAIQTFYDRYNHIFQRKTENGTTWSDWEKITTETDLSNALTDYRKKTDNSNEGVIKIRANTTEKTPINVNAGGSQKAGYLLMLEGNTGSNNLTYVELYLIRCGYSGNNVTKTLISSSGSKGSFSQTFGVSDDGYLTITSNIEVSYYIF